MMRETTARFNPAAILILTRSAPILGAARREIRTRQAIPRRFRFPGPLRPGRPRSTHAKMRIAVNPGTRAVETSKPGAGVRPVALGRVGEIEKTGYSRLFGGRRVLD
jgi:hypothetical protein